MDLLATLFLGHLIADFPLQSIGIYQLKVRHRTGGLALHAAIHVLVTALLVMDPIHNWRVLGLLGAAHFITDWLKLRFPTRPQIWGFLIDQVAHGAVIALVASKAPDLKAILPPQLLYPALVYATIPALTMSVWVLADDLSQAMLNVSASIKWTHRRMLQLSRLAGLPLLIAVTARLLIIR